VLFLKKKCKNRWPLGAVLSDPRVVTLTTSSKTSAVWCTIRFVFILYKGSTNLLKICGLFQTEEFLRKRTSRWWKPDLFYCSFLFILGLLITLILRPRVFISPGLANSSTEPCIIPEIGQTNLKTPNMEIRWDIRKPRRERRPFPQLLKARSSTRLPLLVPTAH